MAFERGSTEGAPMVGCVPREAQRRVDERVKEIRARQKAVLREARRERGRLTAEVSPFGAEQVLSAAEGGTAR